MSAAPTGVTLGWWPRCPNWGDQLTQYERRIFAIVVAAIEVALLEQPRVTGSFVVVVIVVIVVVRRVDRYDRGGRVTGYMKGSKRVCGSNECGHAIS